MLIGSSCGHIYLLNTVKWEVLRTFNEDVSNQRIVHVCLYRVLVIPLDHPCIADILISVLYRAPAVISNLSKVDPWLRDNVCSSVW